jgi:hypothetical protein
MVVIFAVVVRSSFYRISSSWCLCGKIADDGILVSKIQRCELMGGGGRPTYSREGWSFDETKGVDALAKKRKEKLKARICSTRTEY